MIRNIENQMHFAGQVVQCAEAQDASTVEVKETAYTDYSRRIDDAHDRLVWTHPGTENWYRNSQGRVVAITPWRNDAFWRMTRSPDEADLQFDHRQESSGAA